MAFSSFVSIDFFADILEEGYLAFENRSLPHHDSRRFAFGFPTYTDIQVSCIGFRELCRFGTEYWFVSCAKIKNRRLSLLTSCNSELQTLALLTGFSLAIAQGIFVHRVYICES